MGFSSRADSTQIPRPRKAVYVVRHFMRPLFITTLLFTLTACGQTQNKSQKESRISTVDTTHKPTKSMSDYYPTIDKAHPTAKRLMNEDFYWNPIEETAPFGNDDGADTYASFADWRQTHKTENPMEFLMEQIDYWGYPNFDLNETSFEKLKPYLKQSDLGTRFMSGIDAAIVSIAFGQLYLEGTIYKDFKEVAKTAIKRQLIPEMLNLWGDTYKTTRETQLKKMLAVLNQLN
jgi:uncharacterized protein YfeS